jgi:hypothetical protein
MTLWLEGGRGTVQIVLLFKWSKLVNGRVKADIEVYNLDQAGDVNLLQTEVIINWSNIVRCKHMKLMLTELGSIPNTTCSRSSRNHYHSRAAVRTCDTRR